MERYFTPEKSGNELTDRFCEAIFHTCMDCAAALMKNPKDYDARANIMVAAALSHNGLTGMGRTGDWASHFIEHKLSGEYDVTHGAGLAVITPAWMKYVYKDNPNLFLKWATRVMGVAYDYDDPENTISKGSAASNLSSRALASLQGFRKCRTFQRSPKRSCGRWPKGCAL